MTYLNGMTNYFIEEHVTTQIKRNEDFFISVVIQ